jgi:dipeptidase E
MKFYLSSFKLGNKAKELARLMFDNKRIGYIPNACDYTNVDMDRRNDTNKNDMAELSNLGLSVELLDLKGYFGKTEKLSDKINELGGVFIRGGNTFILRQAMKLSGFDKIFKELLKRDDFVYAGYSAGICVLAPNFKALQIVDDPTDKPYKELQETIWGGLSFLDYIILPHYKSDHPESADIDKEAKFCKKNNIPFKTLRDGEVIIIE